MNIPDISVIIITRNRPGQLLRCLKALRSSTFSNFELCIVDQSDFNPDRRVQIYLRNFPRFHYIKSTRKGKSKGLNQAIRFTSTPLLSFTDDDCVPDKDWLKNIVTSFKNYPQVSGIFGKTLPYQPEKHLGFECPSVTEEPHAKLRLISQARKHWELGYGNNMSFRRSTFEKFGLFKEWLGPGSIGSNAEDAEMTLRALKANQTLLYDPNCLTYHDRWVTPSESNRLLLSYVCGEVATYGYLALTGDQLGKKVIIENLTQVFYTDMKYFLYLFFHLRKKTFQFGFWWGMRVIARLRGAGVAMYFFLRNDKPRFL